jgi:hypothetical protein
MEDYIVIRKAVSEELCKFLATEFNLIQDIYKAMYPGHDPADMCAKTFARYAPIPFETLSVTLKPVIEKAVNMRLHPTYSYGRIYYKNTELNKHKDRASSEVTVSVCIEKDLVDWPLCIKTDSGKIYEVNLNLGDIVIYSGRKHEHWREPFDGDKQIQAFLQYVNAEGDDAWLKWDTRPCLGLPFEYATDHVKSEISHIKMMHDLVNSVKKN